jgi:hypothetical protein
VGDQQAWAELSECIEQRERHQNGGLRGGGSRHQRPAAARAAQERDRGERSRGAQTQRQADHEPQLDRRRAQPNRVGREVRLAEPDHERPARSLDEGEAHGSVGFGWLQRHRVHPRCGAQCTDEYE